MHVFSWLSEAHIHSKGKLGLYCENGASHETVNYCKFQLESIQAEKAQVDPNSNLDGPNIELILICSVKFSSTFDLLSLSYVCLNS